jgi:methionine transaminase
VIQSKIPLTGTTIFSVMSALAEQHGAVNLGQGFPGFPVDVTLIDMVHKAMSDGLNQYAPMPGLQILRDRLAEKIHGIYGADIRPASEITVTAGATQAVFTAITALIHPGDEVILFAPAYDCYAPAVQLCGGTPVWINLSHPDYSVPWEEVESRITPRTRMIVINTPGNPSSSVLRAHDMERLQKIVAATGIFVLSDEVYEHIVFDGLRHESVLRYPGLFQRSIAVYSFGKTFHATGWKTGYAVAPEYLMNEFRKVHQYNVFSCNTPVQAALAEYLRTPGHYLDIPQFYQRKRDLFLSNLKDSRFTWKPAQGTYFQLLNFSAISDRPDTEMAAEWTRNNGIASIPVSCFYPDGTDRRMLRFCFAKEDHVIEQAAAILSRI